MSWIDVLLKDVAAESTLKHRCTLGISHSHTHTQAGPTALAVISVFTRGVKKPVLLWQKASSENEKCRDDALNSVAPRHPSQNCTHTHVVRRQPLTRTDRVNGDEDRGVKQRGEIWRQEETERQNKRGGSRGMEHRMKLTDIKTARTHWESFPFLRANIQRLVGVGGGVEERHGEREREKERLS